MRVQMTKTLRFWVEVEFQSLREDNPERSAFDLKCAILQRFEQAGDAMRYLDARGLVAWKASPRMLASLADAEREVEDDWDDCC
jgi:hypothetical protein